MKNIEESTPTQELLVAATIRYAKEKDKLMVKKIIALLSLRNNIGKNKNGMSNEINGVARFLFTKTDAGRAV